MFGGVVIADTRRALRVLETRAPARLLLPLADVRREHLTPSNLHTWCAFMGMASYFDVKVGDRVARDAAWHYPTPAAGYEALAGYIAFYPDKMDACYVDGERVQAQTETPTADGSRASWRGPRGRDGTPAAGERSQTGLAGGRRRGRDDRPRPVP